MPKIEHTLTPEAGRYDFDGKFAPHNSERSSFLSFVLIVFQWLPKAGAKGAAGELKRSKGVGLIQGSWRTPKTAYEQARQRCAELNAPSTI